MGPIRTNLLALFFSFSFIASLLQADIAVVTNFASGDVTVIDTATNSVLATISVGSEPFGVAITPDGRFAYVSCFSSTEVSVIDLTTLSLVTNIPAPSGNPTFIAITPNGRFAYVTSDIVNEVYVIDTSTNTVVGSSIPVGTTPRHISIGVTPNGTYAYVANQFGPSVSIIDTAINTVIQTLAMPVGSKPEDVELAPNGLFAYVTDLNNGVVYVIDTTPPVNTLLTTISIVGAAETNDVTFSPNGSLAYVTDNTTSNVFIIDTATNSVVPPTITGFNGPIGIGITPEDTFAYVANNGGNNVAVVNLATNAITTTIPTGISPYSVAIAPSPISPVSNLIGRQKKDDFGFLYEFYNVIKWGPVSPAPTAPIAGYNIYRNGVLIATVGPNTFRYKDHNVKKGSINTYCVFAFLANGIQSRTACVTIQ